MAPERSSESAVHAARRAQLVDAAIDVLARDGYAAASTVRIARAAGVSRGVLTYHFRDRADLIAAVVQSVYALAGAELGPRVVRAGSPRASLLAFIGGSVGFYAAHPRHLAALSAVFTAQERDGTRHHRTEMDDVGALLRAGVEAGEFRAFDVEIMAGTIRAALDAALVRVTADRTPAAAARVRDELVRTFDLATRKENP
ncbi:TetR family transcriptional regulator [Amycolatopsis sp. NBC_00355]|uniref:TetR/AcrR family transcriptional regulator n=1 Tax=Amycolatopsis sp. NBC_00355 TaxID=2975957 RepID=UPI002E26F4D4